MSSGTINIQPWSRVKGMYQPDALASFTVDGETFIVSANEGDARDYARASQEESRCGGAVYHGKLAGLRQTSRASATTRSSAG